MSQAPSTMPLATDASAARFAQAAHTTGIAVITGGTRGIGRAISVRLARQGHPVVVHYRSDHAAAGAAVQQIEEAGGAAIAVSCDLSVLSDGADFWQCLDEALPSHSRGALVQVLVNNAAISPCKTLEQTSPADFDEVIATNLRAVFLLARAGLARVCQGGRIINVSSGGTRVAIPHYLAYAASKGGLDVFTRALAKELGPRGITVNAVSPGVIDTEMNAWWLDEPGARERTIEGIALGRIGQPEDVADVVAFLASSDARWVTGQLIDVTGGAQL